MNSIPVINRSGYWSRIRDYWEDVAWHVAGDIAPLSRQEQDALATDLHAYEASLAEDGSERAGDMLSAIYARHLRDRPWWHWGEFEYWRQIALAGDRPPYFRCTKDPYAMKLEDDIYDFLTLPQAKKLLATAGLQPPKKDVTKGIAAMVREDTRLFLHFKRGICLTIKEQEFRQIPMHIRKKAESMETASASQNEGFPIMLAHVRPGEDRFIAMALRRNPAAIPPYWPGALACWAPDSKSWLEKLRRKADD